MPALVSVYAADRDQLKELAAMLREEGVETAEPSRHDAGAGDLHLDPALLDQELWRLVTVVVSGLASGAGKALASWALQQIRERRDSDPPVEIRLRGEKLVLRTEADREKLVAALAALGAE